MHLVLTGNTGSGKTTLARELELRLGLPRISSGDIARSMSEDDPSTNLALQQGAMAPEAAMRVAVRQRIEEADATRGGWILEGFPRSTEQLICLMQWTPALPVFVNINVGAWTCIERLVARDRSDDNPDAMARRLESFRTKTVPMLDLLEAGGVLTHIDGHRSSDTVADNIESLVIAAS